MTNEFDELEQQDQGQDPERMRHPGVRANLTNAWRTQPLIKLLVLMVIVAAVAGIGMTLFSSGSERASTTSVGAPPALHEAPGGNASQYVKDQTALADKEREQEALQNHGSSLPTPMGGDNTASKDDTLKELKAQIESLTHEVNKPREQPRQVQQVQTAQPEQFDDSLAKAMQKEMGDLQGSWTPHGIKQVAVTKAQAEEAESTTSDHSSSNKDRASGVKTVETATAQNRRPKILVPAGTVSYSKLMIQANSDVPGPVLADIVSGPLNGARAIGSFEVANEYSDYLVLKFKLAELNGKEYGINAVAIDPDTSLPGLATEVDQRYFERVVLPAAGSFLQAFGSALGSNGNTLSTNGQTTIATQAKNGFTQGYFSGLGQAGQTAGQFFQNQANKTKPLIVVAAGTPMGLLFVTSLVDGQEPTPFGQQQASTYSGYSAGSGNQGGQSGQSYLGASSNGYGGASGQGVPYPNYGTSTNNGYGGMLGNSAFPSQGSGIPNYLNPNFGVNTGR